MKFFTTSKLSENIRKTPEGYLVCLGVSIARTGEMIYGAGETPIEPGPDGKVVIQREAAEVFRPETMASFEGKSFTVLHPKDFVNPKNWRALTTGLVQNVRRGSGEQENDLVADILVTDSESIRMVESGVREVSCGYEAEYVEMGRGRGVQKNIIGNHVALVEEGRAGEAYAINDHKGDRSMKAIERIKSIFAKATDEAMKVSDEEKKEEGKAKDEVSAYDQLCGMMKDMGKLIDGLKPKDASSQPTQAAPAEVVAKDDEVAAPSMDERMKKLEDAVAKLLEGKAAAGDEEKKDDEEAKDEESEEADDAEESEESDDAAEEKEEKESKDEEKGELVGDSVSRIEILAPGLKATGKDAKVKALQACYATTDGKTIIERFTGNKPVDYKDENQVNAVFIGASELLKTERAKALSHTKTFDLQTSSLASQGAVSAEDINKKNEAHYGKQ